MNAGGEGLVMAVLVLIGGILALLGALGSLTAKIPAKLLPIGGILAIAGEIWAVARIGVLASEPVSLVLEFT
ncbi:MAG: hypothetical protein AB1476_06055 [Candidatus Hadarchaeota archaeon]